MAPAKERDSTPGGSQRTKKKAPCGHCKKETTGGTSVPCGFCETWFHTECIDGMSDQFRECCDAMNRINGGSAFLCVICRKLATKLNGTIADVNKKVDALEARVQKLELENKVLNEKVEKTESKAEQVKGQIGGMEKEIEEGMRKAKEEVKVEMSTEMKNREERKANIVVYGIEESDKVDAEERKKEDEKKVAEVAAELGVAMEGKVEVKWRLGKKVDGESKPRPLIVRFEDGESRTKLLEKARFLARNANPAWKRVYLAPDMTWQQREEARKKEEELRKQAEKMTEEAGKTDGSGEVYRVVGTRGTRRIVIQAQAAAEPN